jgi:hypothetical protein
VVASSAYRNECESGKFYCHVSVGDFAPSGFQTALASPAVQLRNPG